MFVGIFIIYIQYTIYNKQNTIYNMQYVMREILNILLNYYLLVQISIIIYINDFRFMLTH